MDNKKSHSTIVDSSFAGAAARAAERRAAGRKVLRLNAKVTLPGERTFDAYTVDLSIGGASLETPFRLSVGQDCFIHLDVSACGSAQQIVIIGRICRCNDSGLNRFRIGMQFVQMEEETAQFIAQAVK